MKQIEDLTHIVVYHNSFARASAQKTFQNFHPEFGLRKLLSGTNRGVTHQSVFCVSIGIVISFCCRIEMGACHSNCCWCRGAFIALAESSK